MKDWISPIPKIVHLIWIGTNPYPDYFLLFMKSFKKYLPEFEIRIWGNKSLNKKDFPKTYGYIQKAKKVHGKNMYDEDNYQMFNIKDGSPLTYSKWAQITDLMRLEIVYNQGGYYFDTTFEILKPLYNLLNIKNKSFIGCNELPRFKDHNKLSNSFFGTTKHNLILKRLLQKNRLDDIDFYEQQVDLETGPGFLRSGIYKSDFKNVHIFPSTYFYPFIEPLSAIQKNPPYRKSGKNKCATHSNKAKKGYIKLDGDKGYIKFPCNSYKDSYALKHWQLGKSWTNFLEYEIQE